MKNRKIELSGIWELNNENQGWNISAQVPGDTHSAALNAEKIDDPYWGKNELALQQLNQDDWLYSRSFQLNSEFLDSPSIFLNCERLDTFSKIKINGNLVGATENTFRRYRFEVKPYLVDGENKIEILFESPEKHAVELGADLPYEIPWIHHDVESPHRNLVRKIQCHAGWDWGICLMVSGIYGDLSLVSAPKGRIEHVYTEQLHESGKCDVVVQCEVEACNDGESLLELELGGQSEKFPVLLKKGLNHIQQTVVVENPQLWWPAGYGGQPLYDLTVKVAGDEVKKRIGIRALELISEEDEVGLSFVFRVNGVDIFCKGSNWIPCDSLPERETREVLDDLLSSAAEANMNMIRVWGGGQYESEDFYDLCDEKGLLVWQDFMFACATYPALPDFLDNVKHEAIYQIKRLRDHASLALWCGNNENIGALTWFEATRKNRDRYLVDYDRLNEGVLGKAVDHTDPTRTFWPSSPCGGRGDYSDAFHNDNRGDMHFWGVWHAREPFENFYKITPRFCSEFGYQSFPSMETVRSYAPEEQMNISAPIMEHHQRSPSGNSTIIEMFSRYFRMPEGFENFVFLSQVQQGLAMKTAVEFWRTERPTCMGALYWQLNDNWPVASWSSLNYGGKWKVMHYMAKRFFTPTLITAVPKEEQVEVWMVNDQREAKSGKVMIEVYDFDGKQLREIKEVVEIPAGEAALVRSFEQNELIENPSQGFLLMTLEVDGNVFQNDYFFAKYKACDLLPASIETTITEVDTQQWSVELKTDKPAFFVTLNADSISGEFDDNGFTLVPGQNKTVVFKTKREVVSTSRFTQQLSHQHLRTTYK